MTDLNLGIQESGNPEIWKSGIQQITKIQILKIKIRVAQDVDNVWISRKKHVPAPFAAISGKFVHGPEKCKKMGSKKSKK